MALTDRSGGGGGAAASPDLPWKTRLAIAAYNLGVDLSRRSNGTINRLLMKLFDPRSPPSTVNGITSSDFTVDSSSSRHLWVRLYTPTNNSSISSKLLPLPLLVYFHGGGFVFFAPSSKAMDDLCFRLASQIPAVVVSVNYRLAPEHRFPSQYDDAFDTLKFIDSALSDAVLPPTMVDRSRCFVAGDSAGANIAHHVTARSSTTTSAFERLHIIGLMAVQPFFGGEERTESEIRLNGKAPVVNLERTDWMWKAFLPQGSDRNHWATNVVKGGEISMGRRFPATMVVVGGWDPLQDWQRRYCDWLKKNKYCEVEVVEYPNAIHAFYAFPELPGFHLFIKAVADFIGRQSSSSSSSSNTSSSAIQPAHQ